MLYDNYDFVIEWFLRLDGFNNRSQLIDPFQEFEYFTSVFHSCSYFMGNIRSCIFSTSELQKNFWYFRILITVVVKISNILNYRANFISPLTSFHDHRESGHISSHVLSVLEGNLGCITEITECLRWENTLHILHI